MVDCIQALWLNIWKIRTWCYILIIVWKIKLIYTLITRCKYMCCSQQFPIYLLSLQNILFFDWYCTSYVILLIYMLDWNSIVCNTRHHLITLKDQRLPRKHILILFAEMQFFFGSMWLLHCSCFFFCCKSFQLDLNKISCIKFISSCRWHYQGC